MEKPPAEAVIAIAVAYDADVLVGLVVSGHITRAYVESGVRERLSHVPAYFMTDELARRAESEWVVPAVPPEWEPPHKGQNVTP